jgi:hypothetical protein
MYRKSWHRQAVSRTVHLFHASRGVTVRLHRSAAAALLAASAVTLAIACSQSEPSDTDRTLEGNGVSLAAAKKLDVSRCATTNPGFTTAFTNPFFLHGTVGYQLVLEADEDGHHTRNEMTILNVTRNVGGVTVRVLEEREFVDKTLTEVTWNYHVQASDGSICYFGEDVDAYENGTITHEGAWCGVGANQPGIFIPADPQQGMEFQQEVAPGIAMDEARIVGKGPVTVPFGTFRNTIRIREFNPLDGGKAFKVLAEGVGFVIDGSQVLTAINQTSGAPPQPTLTLIACGT